MYYRGKLVGSAILVMVIGNWRSVMGSDILITNPLPNVTKDGEISLVLMGESAIALN
ncbi:hypothetical protein HC931_01990 [Candidatus Gracilibacteria bacterium]|nr:hypothetical protein [Candidatus Gracilibacteria bacterium]